MIGLDHRFALLPASRRSPCSKKSRSTVRSPIRAGLTPRCGMQLLDTTGIRWLRSGAATLKDLALLGGATEILERGRTMSSLSRLPTTFPQLSRMLVFTLFRDSAGESRLIDDSGACTGMVLEVRQGFLPLALRRFNRKEDLDRAGLLIESLGRHWCDRRPFELLIVVPNRDANVVRSSLPHVPRISVTVRPESDFFSTFSPYYLMTGWYRQQVLKLYVPARLGFDGYLTFDADVFCVGDFGPKTFVREGRLLSQWEPKEQQEWWRAACEAVGIPYDANAQGLSVTPNVLHGQLAQQAIEHVANDGNDPTAMLSFWAARKPGEIAWTEYSLYTNVAELKDNLFDYHLTPTECYLADVHLTSSRSSVWGADDFERLAALPNGNDPGGTFIVVQSHARIPVEQVRKYCFSFEYECTPISSTLEEPRRETALELQFERPWLSCDLEARIVASLCGSESPEEPPAEWWRFFQPVTRECFTNSDGVSRQGVIGATARGSVVWPLIEPDNEDTEAVRLFVDSGSGDMRQIGYLPRGHGIHSAVATGRVCAWFASKSQDDSGLWSASVYLMIKKA